MLQLSGNPAAIIDRMIRSEASRGFLVLDPGTIQLSAGATGNQAGFDVLLNLEGARLTNALMKVSGETATGAQQSAFNAASMFMGQMTDPFNAGRSDAAASGGTSSFAAEADAYMKWRNGFSLIATFEGEFSGVSRSYAG